MKPSILFIGFKDHGTENRGALEIEVRVGLHKFKSVTIPETGEDLSSVFKRALKEVAVKAHEIAVTKGGYTLPPVYGMLTSDLFSMFTIKQTKEFNNAIHKAGREGDILFIGF